MNLLEKKVIKEEDEKYMYEINEVKSFTEAADAKGWKLKEIEEHLDKLNRYKEELEPLSKGEVEAKKNENNLKRELDELVSQRKSIVAEKENFGRQAIIYEREAKEIQKENVNIQKEIEKVNDEKSNLEVEVRPLREKNEEVRKTDEEYTKQIKEFKESIKNADEKMEKESVEKKKIEYEIKRMQEELESLEKEKHNIYSSASFHLSSFFSNYSRVISSLSSITFKFTDDKKMKREGNTITHNGAEGFETCVIDYEMSKVCFYCLSVYFFIVFFMCREYIICLLLFDI